MTRGSRYSLQRVEARVRRVRGPHEVGWRRRFLWAGWQAVASLARPMVFVALACGAGYLAFDGVRHLDSTGSVPHRGGAVSHAFGALAPDAAAASAIWSRELDAAMQPRHGVPPDEALAMSLTAAFEDMVGRERFSSLIWAETHAFSLENAEAVLRALPVWVRHRELEAAWARRVTGSPPGGAGVLALAPAAARTRLERASRLYQGVQSAHGAFFAGHETGALNLARLPGLSQTGSDLWLLPDSEAEALHCAAAQELECALARMGGDAGAGQGARHLRAALLTGHAGDGFHAALLAADRSALTGLSREIAAVARQTSNIDAIRLTALLDTPQDAARLRCLSQEAGPRSLALAHFHGRGALALVCGDVQAGLMTPEARSRFALAAVLASLAFGIVLAALASAFSVRLTGRAGLGQRLDLAMRELLLGRKA